MELLNVSLGDDVVKTRIISGTLCVVVLAAILCFYQTLVLEAAISVLAAVAVYELLSADGFKEHKPFLITAVITAALIPAASIFGFEFLVAVIFLAVAVVLTLRFHSKIGFEKLAFYVMATLFVSFSFLCIVYLRNDFKANGLIYILIAFGGAWFADTGAYFTGRFLGKHKLSPQISPKKTVEGLIGGVLSNILLLDLMAYVYTLIMSKLATEITVNYIALSIIALVIAFAGTAGDLIASVIKRQIGIKDYGNLIPGHGGIMDRFDSILFTTPVLYIVTRFVTVIS